MALDPAHLLAAFGMAPEMAVAFFESKGYKITGDWHEMLDEAHAKAFTVANGGKMDILQDIRSGLEQALKEGKTERWFIKNLTPILQRKGWWSREERIDTGTGEIRNIQLGSPERLRTIYRTNLQSAYMAGRWKGIEEARDSHPYVQYIAVMDGSTRASHAAMNGRVFRVDDPIWRTHASPNGYNCRCRQRPMSKSALKREGIELSSSKGMLTEIDWPISARNPSLGTSPVTVYKAPGMDKGFAPDVGFNYNPGMGGGWWTPERLDSPAPTTPLTKGPVCFSCPGEPPAPRPWHGKLLDAGKGNEYYVREFLRAFGADIGKPALFDDATGEPLWITDALFLDRKRTARGDGPVYKVQKNGREPYLLILAETIRNPQEIWESIEYHNALQKTVLRRRYLAWWEVEGQNKPGLTVFEHGIEGWFGVTAFDPSNEVLAELDAYLAGVRRGIRKWRE